MEFDFFFKGLVIGFAMAVPIGPAGVMVIRKTLSRGHIGGIVVGLGAATTDLIYGSIAAFGLTFVSDVILGQQIWLRLVGGAVLVMLGIRSLRDKRQSLQTGDGNEGLFKAYVSGLLLSLTNPVTFLAFVAAFAAFGLGYRLSVASSFILVIGVLIGSSAWFTVIGYIATLFRKQLDGRGLGWVNRISGTVIIVTGVAIFISLI
ncbi:MAG: LysE family transporter [Candidatus Zixiibacteriota bacterium]